MRHEVLQRLAPARPVVFTTLADALRPRRPVPVAQLAEDKRVVAEESGSRYPGPWRNARAPHMVDVMNACGPDDPAEDIICTCSAQVAKTETAINLFLHIVDQDPGPTIIVLPSHDEAGKFVNTKLQPAIDATPALRSRVLEFTDRSSRGSTASFKRFRGGFAQITFAGSSKGLQMLPARYTIGDEVSEWPAEAGTRGDPVTQLKKRTETFERDRKRLWTSTPGVRGSCRITEMYEASDQRRRYVPCPVCGAYQVLQFDQLRWESDVWPHHAWFECLAHGCVIEHEAKSEMMEAGVWIATAGEDAPPHWFEAGDLDRWRARSDEMKPRYRSRGFHVWKAYSLFSSWNGIVAEYLDAKDSNQRMRVFTQQVLGEAWEDKGDAPDADKLWLRRVPELHLGQPGRGPVVFTGATDVQGNRLEWAVWGWSEGMTRWLVDRGVIEGDPSDAGTWIAHDEVVARRYGPEPGRALPADLWGVDSGYMSQMVYNYARRRPNVLALDGRDGRTMPFLGLPKKVDVKFNGKRVGKGAMLWPVGTYPLKGDHYAAIRRTIDGPDEGGAWSPGAMILPGDVDLAYCEQLTAEYLDTVEQKSGVVVQQWKKLKGRPNEALDIAVYARAMAYHLGLDRLTADQWEAARIERFGPAAPSGDDPRQAEMFEVRVAPAAHAAPAPTAPEPKRAPERSSGDGWLGPLRGKW
jgi:phage terminase large subunit GpA-like protein